MQYQGPGGPSWKDKTLIEHMATSHGFDAASEAGRRGLPGLDTYSDYMNGERSMWTGKPQEQPFPTGLGSQLLVAHAPKKRTFIDDDLGVVAQHLGETFDRDRKRTRAAYTRRLRPALPLPQKTTTLQPSSIQIRRRKILPMVLENGGQTFSLSACPDSGSDVNVISLSEAQRLGCAIEPLGADVSKFYLANGQPAGAIGKAMAVCSFATGTPWTDSVLSCVFHVFSTLAVPLIMGMRFLEMTETLSKHQDRLVEEVAPSGHLIRLNSVGTPLKSLVCKLDGHEAMAIADTGFDLDFLSESYARSRGFRIEEAFHEVILADGSVALTCGATRVPFAIGQVNEAGDFIPRSQTIEVCFLILEDLSSNILIGQHTALSINVFTEHAESFISSIAHAGESINIIRYKGKLDVAAGRAWAVLRGVRKDNGEDLQFLCHAK